MNSRMLLFLTLATAAPATLAFAGDESTTTSSASVVSASTPQDFVPMTRSERLRRYLTGLVNAEAVVRAASSAGLRQAENSPKEWGGGAEGYGERFGDAFAQHVIRKTLEYGASAVLHEDNRYFPSGQKGFFHRTGYAVASTFLARHDNGKRYFSFSHLGSAAGSAFISRAWEPRSVTSAGDGAANFGIAIGTDAGYNVFREFWPDFKRHFRRN